MEEEFPIVTFLLATIMLAVYLFTYRNLSYYENILGFVPTQPKIHSLITYSFIHANVLHLFFNLVFLFVAGIAVEEKLGKFVYFSVYISSANIAIVFDIMGRFLSGVSFAVPFIGSSGGIFGLLAVASLLNPTTKLPFFLNLFVFVAILLNFLPYFHLISGNILDRETFLFLGGIGLIFFLAFLVLLPTFPPIYIVLSIFLINWMLLTTLNLTPTVSNVGHLGGVLGGIVSFFIFAKKKTLNLNMQQTN